MAGRVRFRCSVLSVFFKLSLLFAVQSSLAWGQNAQVSGLVTDQSRAAISDASVEVVNQDTEVKVASHTNGTGLYIASSLVSGKYRISATAPGFDTQVVENVAVEVGGRISLDFVLHTGKVTQSVTVDATGLPMNTTDATVSTVIDRQFVENIPLNGRSFQ